MNNNVLDKDITDFNRHIKFLSRVYITKNKNTFNEEKTVRDSKRLDMLISSYPTVIFEYMGPVLVKYANLINDEKWDELMEQDFNDEKSQVEENYKEELDSCIIFVKQLYNLCTTKEKEKIGESIQNMLSSYCQYVINTRKTQ